LERIVELLKGIGLSESEAQVYLTLIREGTQQGYEASKNSGISRTKIYALLESLVIKGFALVNKSDVSKVYTAVPVEEIMGVKKKELEESEKYLKDEIERITSVSRMDYLFEIKGRAGIIEKCLSMIKNASKEIYIQVFEEELEFFRRILKEKEEEGVTVILIYFGTGQAEKPLRHSSFHGYTSDKLEDLGGRFINLTCDSEETIFATFSDNSEEAIWTRNRSQIFISREYIKHDVYCLNLIEAASTEDPEYLKKRISSVRNILEDH